MENFPKNWLNHFSPLVAVQGIGGEKSASNSDRERLFRNQNELSTANKSVVLDIFKIWKSVSIEDVIFDNGSIKDRYKFRQISNEFYLPTLVEKDEFIDLDWINIASDELPCLFISFYELGENDEELIGEITELKQQLVSKELRHLAIILSDDTDNERLNRFKRLNGLILNPALKPKELNAFAIDILNIIKPVSIEFYTALEKRLRKQNDIKNTVKIGIAQLFLKNYDQALKTFEFIYDKLLELKRLDDLDLIIYQIVKICLYLKTPNTGYRKFEYHLESGLLLQASERDSWLSKQFKWLAQLVDLYQFPLEKSLIRDGLNDAVMKHSGFLYLQAADLIKNDDEELLNLLRFAKLSFQKKDDCFNRAIGYINYKVGLIQYGKEDYDGSFKSFEMVLDSLKEDSYWSVLESEVYWKLINCCIKLEKHYSTVLNLLELLILPKVNHNIQSSVVELIDSDHFKQFLKEKILINVDDSFKLIEAEVVFKQEKVSMNDEIELQLSLSSNVNGSILESFFIEDLVINFDSSDSVIIKNDFSSTGLKVIDYKTNLQFDKDSTKVLQISLPTTKIGLSAITSITGLLKADLFSVQLNIPISTEFKQHHIWYPNTIIKTVKSRSVETIPRIPKTLINWDTDVDFLITGEQTEFGFIIRDEDYEPIQVELDVDCYLNEAKVDLDWNKDIKLIKNEDISGKIGGKLPQLIGNLDIRANFKLKVNNEYSVVTSLHKSFRVVNPFKVNLSIHPRISEIGSLFILESDTKPSRDWLMRVTMDDIEEVEIVKNELSVVNTNENINIDEVKKDSFDHYFRTTIKDGSSYRTVQFEAQLALTYKRKEKENVYLNNSWKLSLPMLDPRVLLDVDVVDSHDIKLKYYIENPTTKIFSFNVNLLENNHFQITGLKKFMNLNILPSTHQILEFHAVLLGERGRVLLPQLKVYDINYRVNLPTLSASDSVSSVKSDLFLSV